jgi:hypothetical protein
LKIEQIAKIPAFERTYVGGTHITHHPNIQWRSREA